MDKKPSAKNIAIFAAAALGAYLAYQTYSRLMYSKRLGDETIEGAMPAVAVTHAHAELDSPKH